MSSRFEAVDALRGFIMILMAIDHSNAYVARQHSSEFWAGAMTAYTSTFAFVTRLVTHLCAPGFFFLMGAGMVWFSESRRKIGWSEGTILRRVAVRGFVLFLVGQFLENPILFTQSILKGPAETLSKTSAPPPMDGSQLYWGFIVMSGLGLVMLAGSALLRFGPWIWAVAGVACVIATNAFLPANGIPGPFLETLLLAPGIKSHVIVMYPVIPWLGVTLFGMCFGLWWLRNSLRAPKLVPFIGAAMFLAGVALRAAGGFGNIRLPRDGSWIEFFNNVKYPPSLVFWLLSVGVDLMILGVLVRLPEWIKSARSPLMVFGQTPAFFYVTHMALFAVVGFTFFREAAPLEMTYPVWFAALLLLYPACVWYRNFKSSKQPESIWRML